MCRVSPMSDLLDLIRSMPKAELHLHIEGTLEPAMLMQLAEKHSVELPYSSVEDVARAYEFNDLQSFLDLYYLGAGVLVDEDDFYELMIAYLRRCRDEGIVHAEIMFDPQTHTDRGIGFDVFMSGFERARQQAASEWGTSTLLIMCFLRHLPESAALATLQQSLPYRDMIHAVGLDSGEVGNPPEKFSAVFAEARRLGFECVAHAGEEGPPAYIWGALDTLEVSRIDHGVRCVEDRALVERLVREQMPLTVCPLSNVRLRVFNTMADHNILALLDQGLNVCVNSDDPPYFGGYLMDNFAAMEAALGLESDQAKQLVANSIRSSFLPVARKEDLLQQILAS